jgi:hypothetical protein
MTDTYEPEITPEMIAAALAVLDEFEREVSQADGVAVLQVERVLKAALGKLDRGKVRQRRR